MKTYFPVTVYYEDTDAGGIVYHSNYLKFAERARSDFLKKIGLPNKKLLQDGIGIVVCKLDMEFKRPAVLEDELTVHTTVPHEGKGSMVIHQDIFRGDELLVAINVTVVCISVETMRPIRIPTMLFEKMKEGE